MIKRIKGHVLRFEWGMMPFVAEVTGKDAGSPLMDVTASEQVLAIFYGSKARNDEFHGRPTEHSIEECKALMKTFSGKDVQKLIDSWTEYMYIDEDKQINDPEPEVNPAIGDGAKKKKS